MRWTDRRWNRLWLLGLVAVVIACADDGDGCDAGCDILSCDDDAGEPGAPAYTFPDDAPIDPDVVQVHLNDNALDLLGEAIPAAIAGLFGGDSLGLCLEPQELALEPLGEFNLCTGSTCDDDSTGCEVSLEIADVSIVPFAPSTLQLHLLARTDEPQVLDLTGAANCDLSIATEGIPLSAEVTFTLDPDTGRTHVDIPSDRIAFDLSALEIAVDGEDGLCDVANTAAPSLIGVIESQFLGPIDELLGDALGDALCRSCGEEVPCPDGTTCLQGICVDPTTDLCVGMDLGLEDEFDVGALLADFAPGLEARLGFLAYLANRAEAVEFGPQRGLSLALEAGLEADQAACVPQVAAPPVRPNAKSNELHAQLTPFGDPFALGIGIQRDFLDYALWQVWQAGLLCLEIGSDTIPQLNSSIFGLLTPSLRAVTGSQTRPLFLQLKPQRPPRIVLNDAATNPDDAVLTVVLEDLEIDFYTFGFNRYTRIFTLDIDLELEVDLVPTDDGSIQIQIGELDDAFVRVDGKNGELLDEQDITQVTRELPNLLGAFLPDLLAALEDPIDLPEFFGIELKFAPNGIVGVDGGETLALYADIEIGPDGLDLGDLGLGDDLDLGCSASGAPFGAGGLGMVLVLGMMLGLRRRRLKGLILGGAAALLLGAGMGGCSDAEVDHTECTFNSDCSSNEYCDAGLCVELPTDVEDTTTTSAECGEDGDCSTGERCDDGQCVAMTDFCAEDEDCGSGEICEGNACVAAFCTDDADCTGCGISRAGVCEDGRCSCVVACDGGCDEDEYCCYGENTCEARPDPCADVECDPGLFPVETQRADVDTVACDVVDPGICECRATPPLAFGRFGAELDSAVSSDGELRVLASWNTTYGDLVVGIADAEGVIGWHFVDGIPADADAVGAPDGPRGGVEAAGPEAGEGARITISDAGVVAVSYQAEFEDGDTGVRVAVGSQEDDEWTWTTTDIHSGDESGLWSVPVFAGDELWVVYSALRIREVDGDEVEPANWFSEVRAQLVEDGELTGEGLVLDRIELQTPCGGRCTGNFRCLDETNTCTLREASRRCDDECASGEACFSVDDEFVCKGISPQQTLIELPPAGGQFLDAMVADGALEVVHYVRETGALHHITWSLDAEDDDNGGQFTIEEMDMVVRVVDGLEADGDGGFESTGDAGRFARLVRTSADDLLVAYVETDMAELRVANLSEATIVVVDDGLRRGDGFLEFRRVGDSVHPISLDDRTVLVYQDATTHSLSMVVMDEDGEWSLPQNVRFGRTASYFGALGFALAAAPAADGSLVDVWSWRRNVRTEPSAADVVRVRVEP